MAKIKIPFGGNEYLIEESVLTTTIAELKSHLSTVMNGSGATINFDGTSYDIDSTKLSNATNAFVAHLGTIAGSGSEIVVGGVKYNVDSTKLNNAITEMHNTLNNLQAEGDGTSFQIYYEKPYYWLNSVDNGWYYFIFHEDASYETYTDDNQLIGYSNGDAFYEATNDGTNLIASNDNYVIGTFSSDGTIFIMNAKDEMTCYVNDADSSPLHFGVEYIGKVVLEGINYELSVTFNKDGSFISYLNGEVYINCPAGSVFYSSTNVIDMTTGEIVGTVSIDGNTAYTSGFTLTLSGDSGESTSCPIHFGEVYKAYDEGAVKTIVFAENGSFIIRIDGEDSSSGDKVLIYEGNTIKILFGNTIETFGTVSLDGKQITLTNGIIFTLQESTSSGLNEYGFYFGRKYSCTNDQGNKTSWVFYEDGSGNLYSNDTVVISKPAGFFIYEDHKIYSTADPIPNTISADGTQFFIRDGSNGEVYTLEPQSDFTSCPIHFGEIYSAYNAESNKYSKIIFYENGEAAQYVNGELAMGYRLIYEGNTLIDNMLNKGEVCGQVSLDGTIIIIGDLLFSLTEPTSNLVSIPAGAYYGNVVTAEYYDVMPETVSEYDFFAYEDYLYVYMSNFQGWVVMLADELTIAQASQQGMNVPVPSDFVLSNRTKTSYSEVLESINGMPVAIMSLTYAGCSNMVTAPTIPISIIYLEDNYEGCTSLMNITYAGNKMQWGNIFKENGWNTGVPATQVVCSNGIVTL